MLSIHYFASFKEKLNRDRDQIELPANVTTVQTLIDHLLHANPHFDAVFNEDNKVLVAVNPTIVDFSHPLAANDDVAFFPPMTGG